MIEDAELPARYAEARTEAAFSELVQEVRNNVDDVELRKSCHECGYAFAK
jgi:hypothetical protein